MDEERWQNDLRVLFKPVDVTVIKEARVSLEVMKVNNRHYAKANHDLEALVNRGL